MAEPSVKNAGSSGAMGTSEYTNARPRTVVSAASVTTNGASPNLATSVPLTSPKPTPDATPTSMASGMGIPATRPAVTMPEKATTDPTDRSMPPVRMTTSMPNASRPVVTICLSRLVRLAGVRNVSEVSAAVPAISTMSATKAACTVTSRPPRTSRGSLLPVAAAGAGPASWSVMRPFRSRT